MVTFSAISKSEHDGRGNQCTWGKNVNQLNVNLHTWPKHNAYHYLFVIEIDFELTHILLGVIVNLHCASLPSHHTPPSEQSPVEDNK